MDFLLMRLSLVCEQCFVQVCLGQLRLRLVIESSDWLVLLHFAPRYCALLKTVPQRGSKTATHFRATQGHAQRGPDVVIDIPSSGLRPDGEQMCAGVMNTTSLTLQVQHVTHRQQDNMMNPMVPSCVRTCHQTFCLPSTPWPSSLMLLMCQSHQPGDCWVRTFSREALFSARGRCEMRSPGLRPSLKWMHSLSKAAWEVSADAAPGLMSLAEGHGNV